jgi:hypothetical protein
MVFDSPPGQWAYVGHELAGAVRDGRSIGREVLRKAYANRKMFSIDEMVNWRGELRN